MIRFIRDLFWPERVENPAHQAEIHRLMRQRDDAQRALREFTREALDLAGRHGHLRGVAENVADALDRLTQAPDRMIRAGALHEELAGLAKQLRDAVEGK